MKMYTKEAKARTRRISFHTRVLSEANHAISHPESNRHLVKAMNAAAKSSAALKAMANVAVNSPDDLTSLRSFSLDCAIWVSTELGNSGFCASYEYNTKSPAIMTTVAGPFIGMLVAEYNKVHPRKACMPPLTSEPFGVSTKWS